MRDNTEVKNGYGGRFFIASLSVMIIQLVTVSCNMFVIKQDCTRTDVLKSKHCRVIMREATIFDGSGGKYYPGTESSSLEYTVFGDSYESNQVFFSELNVDPRFIVVHTVLYVDSVDYDSMLSQATGVTGASIYCLDTNSSEFRVFNYTVDTSSLRFLELKTLSYRLRSLRTKAWQYMAETVLPAYGHYPKGTVLIHHAENERFVPTSAPFEYSNEGDDDGYRQAVMNYVRAVTP